MCLSRVLEVTQTHIHIHVCPGSPGVFLPVPVPSREMLFMVGLTASAALLPAQPSVLRSAKNGQTWTIKSIDYPKMLAPAIAVPWIGGTVAAGAFRNRAVSEYRTSPWV